MIEDIATHISDLHPQYIKNSKLNIVKLNTKKPTAQFLKMGNTSIGQYIEQ